MAHQDVSHAAPVDDLPLFARGSPPAQLPALLTFDLNARDAPFPTLSTVKAEADLLVATIEARQLPQRVINRAKDFCQPIRVLWQLWTPQRWEHTATTIRNMTSDLFSRRGVNEISDEFHALLNPSLNQHDGQEPAVRANLTGLESRHKISTQHTRRLIQLSSTAKEAFLQQMHYVEIWLPAEPLPSPDRILVNAELGGRYLQFLRHFHFAIVLSAPNEVDRRRQELQDSIPSTFFASLPLDLIYALEKQAARRRGHDEVPHPESIFRFAILDVYTLKLEAIIAIYQVDLSKRKKLETWRDDYFEHFAQRPTWSTAETPTDGRAPVWDLGAVQRYWERHHSIFRDDWQRLDDIRIKVIKEYCASRMLPAIDDVTIIRSHINELQPHLDLHTLSCISLRAARRYGTTQRT
ncbi:hypothetical protein JCM10296v2_006253 [Rhodotorula toruloides]